MRMLRMLAIAALALLLLPVSVSAIDIPEFIPNVVDPSGYLDEPDQQRVNEELQAIRETSHVWGAVLIVDTLDGEPIEDVAVTVFEKWRLGQKGVDNGLLLVLSMNDRQSRFEVGYGLEGSITDVAALHALEDYLAPRMREGDTAGAIVDSFGFLSRIVAQDPDSVRELDQAEAGEDFAWQLGLTAWAALLVAIWFCVPLRNRWVARQRAALQERDPSLSLDDEEIVKTGTAGRPWKTSVFLQCFLSINPGVFVLILSAAFVEAFYVCLAGSLLIMALIVHLSARRYGSPERYRQYLDKVARQRAKMIRKGHLEEKAPGVYAYTAAYHKSQASSSSSSSSRSSGFSSSSGGGRSGGGGASSGW
jgi:uncharacterized protein